VGQESRPDILELEKGVTIQGEGGKGEAGSKRDGRKGTVGK